MAAQPGGVVYGSQQTAQKVARQALQTTKQETRLAGESIKQQFGVPVQAEVVPAQPQGVDVVALKSQEEARIQELRNILAGMRGIDAEMQGARQQRMQQEQVWQQQQAEAMQAATSPAEQQAQVAQEQFVPQAVKARQGSKEMGRTRKG